MEQTARFALPMLAPGQAQKEWFHNEALQRVDTLLCPVVESAPLAQPPASPAEGQCFIVAAGAAGAWAGHDGALAAFTPGGWRFISPIEGLRVLDRASGEIWLRRGGSWESGIVRAQEIRVAGQTVIRQRQPAISQPSGGTTIDAECRSAVTALLGALQAHGLVS
jgi:hypothetical protein